MIAATGLALHEITGSITPDAVGSTLVGVLLGVVAVVLINRNRQFLIGQEVSPAARSAALTALLEPADVDRVTALRMEFIGPRQVYLAADVDLTGDGLRSISRSGCVPMRLGSGNRRQWWIAR